MVSNVFGLTEEQLIARLKEVAAANAFDPEYQEFRSALPDDFPF